MVLTFWREGQRYRRQRNKREEERVREEKRERERERERENEDEAQVLKVFYPPERQAKQLAGCFDGRVTHSPDSF